MLLLAELKSNKQALHAHAPNQNYGHIQMIVTLTDKGSFHTATTLIRYTFNCVRIMCGACTTVQSIGRQISEFRRETLGFICLYYPITMVNAPQEGRLKDGQIEILPALNVFGSRNCLPVYHGGRVTLNKVTLGSIHWVRNTLQLQKKSIGRTQPFKKNTYEIEIKLCTMK